MKKRYENLEFEMLEGAKSISAVCRKCGLPFESKNDGDEGKKALLEFAKNTAASAVEELGKETIKNTLIAGGKRLIEYCSCPPEQKAEEENKNEEEKD